MRSRLFSWTRRVPFCLAAIWACGAIFSDGPLRGSLSLFLIIPWLAGSFWFILKGKLPSTKILRECIAVLVVFLPWLCIRPSNDRPWKAEWARTGWVEQDGDHFTFHEVRDFDWKLDGSVEERWITRTVDLKNLRGLDYFHDAFGGDLLAHPILSFDFGPDGHIPLSIETRRETDEDFSMIGGFYKMFELQYIFGTERDLIRCRTNLRDEPVYIYRSTASLEDIKEGFLSSVRAQNSLKEKPRFYHVVTANCTTSLRNQTAEEKRSHFDWRLLLNGKLDELMSERKQIFTEELAFPDLRKQALINEAAKEAHDAPDFSAKIRKGRIGFSQ